MYYISDGARSPRSTTIAIEPPVKRDICIFVMIVGLVRGYWNNTNLMSFMLGLRGVKDVSLSPLALGDSTFFRKLISSSSCQLTCVLWFWPIPCSRRSVNYLQRPKAECWLDLRPDLAPRGAANTDFAPRRFTNQRRKAAHSRPFCLVRLTWAADHVALWEAQEFRLRKVCCLHQKQFPIMMYSPTAI